MSGAKTACGNKGGEGHTPRLMILKSLKNVTQNEFVRRNATHRLACQLRQPEYKFGGHSQGDLSETD